MIANTEYLNTALSQLLKNAFEEKEIEEYFIPEEELRSWADEKIRQLDKTIEEIKKSMETKSTDNKSLMYLQNELNEATSKLDNIKDKPRQTKEGRNAYHEAQENFFKARDALGQAKNDEIAQKQKKEFNCLTKQLAAKKREKTQLETLQKNPSYQKRQKEFVIYAICSICYNQVDNEQKKYVWELDFSSIKKSNSPMFFTRKKNRNKNKENITSDRCIRFTYQNNVYYEKSNQKDSFPQLIKTILKDPVGCAYLLVYLAKLLKNFSVFEHYGICEKDFETYACFSPNAFTSQKDNIAFKNFISEIATLLSGKGPSLIDSTLKINDLLENGWKIIADKKAISIYDSNPHHSASLQNAILKKAKQSPEIQYFLFGNNLKSNRNAYDILKLVTNIKIFSIDSLRDDRIFFQISLDPIFETCQSMLENKIEKILAEEPREYSCWDARLFLGKIANSTAARNRPHIFTKDIDIIANATPMEKVILNDAIFSGIVIKDESNEKDCYSFCNKYIRIILDAFFTSQKNIFKSSCSENIEKALEMILNYGDGPDATDHRKYNLSEASCFAMTIIQNIDCSFRDSLIQSLCNTAKNFSSSILQKKQRLYQEISSLILSYFLYTNHHQLPIERQKNIFDVCYASQWYPQQFDLLKEFLKYSNWFAEYIGSEFSKSLEKKENFICAQPKFYFLQHLSSNKTHYDPFLQNAIECQYNTWHLMDKVLDSQTNEFKLMKQAIDDFCSLSRNDFTSVEKVFGCQLIMYSLANIGDEIQKNSSGHFPCSKILQHFKVEEEQIQDYELKLVLHCILSDYNQKKQNPLYLPPNDRSEMLLICGSYRLINTLSFEVKTIKLNDDQLNDYRQILRSEKTNSRYFWFIYRLLSYTNFKLDDLLVNEDCNQNISSDSCKFKTQNLKAGYESIAWLKYDNFPLGYEQFIKNPKGLDLH